MNRRKWIRWILAAVPVFFLFVFALSYIPHKLVRIEPEKVSEICIYDEKSVKIREITDKSEITHIINDLNNATFQKGKPSLGFIGFSLNTAILDKQGNEITELTIISNDTIRYNGFFYKSSDHAIDFQYIEELVGD